MQIRRLGMVTLLALAMGVGGGKWAWADDAATHYNMALQLKQQGDVPGALAAVNRAIAARPDYAAAYFTQGNLFRQVDKLEEAAQSYRKTLELSPKMVEARGNLGAVYVRLGRLDEGIKELEQAAAVGDNDKTYGALLSLGVAYRQKDQHDRAVAVLERAVKIRPEDPQGWTNLGVARARTPDKQGAVAAYKKAVELDPKRGEFHFNLGTAYRRLRQTEQAIAAYENAVSLDPNLAGAHYDLGVLYAQERDNEKALAAFRKYLQVSGKSLPTKDRQNVEERISGLEGMLKR